MERRQKKVLILDSPALFMEFLKEKLAAENVEVEIASGKREALMKLVRLFPNLVIKDAGDSYEELLDFLQDKLDDPNAKRSPTIVTGPRIKREQIAALVKYGVIKYFSKPIKFDVFFESIGKTLHVNLPMDDTPCLIEIHRKDDIILIEIAHGLNREKLSLLKFKLAEMFENYIMRNPKILILITDLQLSYVDGINLELLFGNIATDLKVKQSNIKILSHDNFMLEFIKGHEEFSHIEPCEDIILALDSIVKSSEIEMASPREIANEIIENSSNETVGSVDIQFGSEQNSSKNNSRISGSLLNIALLDGDEKERQLISSSFAAVGVKTDAFDSKEKFLEAVNEKEYDFAIIDLFISSEKPDFEIIEVLNLYLNKIPIIIYSKNSQKEYVYKATCMGVKAYLTKPQKPIAIFKKIMRFLNREVEEI